MGDANIIIRRANKNDAGTIALLIARLAQATGQRSKMTSTEADFARYGFGTTPAFNVLLAEASGNAVGLSLWFYNFSSWRGQLGAYLQDLYVDDSQRGTGLGRRLLAETAALARADGATHLRLSVDTDNTGAQDFYKHLGFVARVDEDIYQISDQAFAALAGVRHT